MAAIAAIALHFVILYDTPIDGALPVVFFVVCAAAAFGPRRHWVALSGPLLACAAVFLPDERTRLLTCGVIVAAAYAVAVYFAPRTRTAYLVLTVAGVLVLRWIPLSDVVVWRELFVLGGVVAVLMMMPELTPLSIAGALAIGLVTPIFPARAMLYPLLVAALVRLPIFSLVFLIAAFWMRNPMVALCIAAAFAVSASLLARVRPLAPAFGVVIAFFALWPWSGIAARAMPNFLFAEPSSPQQRVIGMALPAGQSVSIDAPPHAHGAVVTASGANTFRMRAGRVVGGLEIVSRSGRVTRRDLRIGDIADFGFMRREHFFRSRNPMPRNPTDDIRGYGATAWLHGAGRVFIAARDMRTLRIAAAPDLPPTARLQIEAVDFE